MELDRPPKISLGVATLMRGRNADAKLDPSRDRHDISDPVKSGARRTLPAGILFGADLLLCGLAMLLAFRQEQFLRSYEMIACIAAVLMGACLSCSTMFQGTAKSEIR